jgi:chromosome segregation ATPase
VIEPIMFFVLGCLAAFLLALVILPLVHARAVRLTTRRLEGAIPVSIAEIHADKDHLRAEFAMATRRLELSLEQMRAKTAFQAAEIGRKLEIIGRLKAEIEDKTLSIAALEVRDKPLLDRVQSLEEDLKHKTERLQTTEQSLAAREAALAKITRDYEERSLAFDSQRVELVAATTQGGNLKDQLEKREKELATTSADLQKERTALEKATRDLIAAGEKAEKTSLRADKLDRDLAVMKADNDRLSKRIQELDTQVSDQTRRLSDSASSREQLAAELEAARAVEADLKREAAEAQRRHASEIQTLITEKNLVEAELERNREERSKLKREITALKREVETNGAEERAQNALLRESISDVAAQVVRLTSQMEGAGSAIETILADDASPPVAPVLNGKKGQGSSNGGNETGGAEARSKASLADRIRALQTRTANAQASPPGTP